MEPPAATTAPCEKAMLFPNRSGSIHVLCWRLPVKAEFQIRFFDARCILGENSFMGLDFVDHIQKLIYEYNGNAWHGNDEQAAKDRFKFEAARKAGYAMIRVLEPGLEVLDPKYDIVMPEGFGHHGKYDTEIMEEVGRKVIHLLEEIYGRKASPEIWALNNFKEFEVWYNTNKKELEANALENMLSHKTAAKKAA